MADQGLEAKAEFGMSLDVVNRKAAPACARRDSAASVDLHCPLVHVILLIPPASYLRILLQDVIPAGLEIDEGLATPVVLNGIGKVL